MSFNINDIAQAMQQNYQRNWQLNEPASALLPDKQRVIDITEDLRSILFPGFFADFNVEDQHQAYRLADQLLAIRNRLIRQASLAICHRYNEEHPGESMNCLEMNPQHPEAIRQVESFLTRLSDIRDRLATDVTAAYDGDPAAKSYADVIISYPGVFAITVHRLAHELYRLGMPLIPRIMSEYAHEKTGIDIHPGATIGDYFFIDHGTGVVIGETTVIGHHVKIYQGVTLGALSTRGGQDLQGQDRHPKIGDFVTIYGGATILGGDTVIGAGATIGGNVFITKSVTPETKVSIRGHNLKFVNPEKKKAAHAVSEAASDKDSEGADAPSSTD